MSASRHLTTLRRALSGSKSQQLRRRRPPARLRGRAFEALEDRRLLVADLGNVGMLGNDLTDLANNGVEGSYVHPPVNIPTDLAGFDAVFFADDEPGFGGGEFSFNVFDNLAGSGSNKWCCNSADAGDGVHVGADFRQTLLAGSDPNHGIILSYFTITSDNDSGISRDPDRWAIQGSDDGIAWTNIFSYDVPGDSVFDNFGGSPENRTLRFDAGTDYPAPAPYKMFRYLATSSVNGSQHALGELEFFTNLLAIADTGATDENTPLAVVDPGSTASLFANDLSQAPISLVVADATSALGALVTVNGDGTFHYNPSGSIAIQSLDDGDSAQDTFDYTITNAIPPDGLMRVQVVNTSGTNPGTSTANWLNLWTALDGGAGPTGSVAGFNVVNNTSDTEISYDYSGGGDFAVNRAINSINNNGPGGGGGPFNGPNDYSIRARTYLQFTSAGTYTISLGSDDGRSIELTEAFAGSAPGYAGFTARGDQVSGAFTPGDTVIGFSGSTGHNQTVGTFTVAAGDILELDAFYYQGAGGHSGEISIASGAFGSFTNSTDFSLLQNGRLGILLESANPGNFSSPTDSSTVTIHLTGLNDAPVAVNDRFNVGESGTLSGNLLNNNGNGADSDIDANDTLTVSQVNASGGNVNTQIALASGALVTVQSDGTFAYDTNGVFDGLADGESRRDTFTYVIHDGTVNSNTATVEVYVFGENDAPTTNDDPTPPLPGAYIVSESGTLSLTAAAGVLANDTDPDTSNGLGVSAVNTGATSGLVTLPVDNTRLGGGLDGQYLDLDDSTDLVGSRTTNSNLLFLPLTPYVASGASDFVLQRLGMSATGDAADVITPRVDFGAGTEVNQGNGSVLDRGGFTSTTVPVWQGLFNDLGLAADMDGEQLAASWSGKIQITSGGTYTFTTRSDDGSVLFINGQPVVNNNKSQGATNRSGSVMLAPGLHDIAVGYYQGTGGAAMQASYAGPDTGSARVIIPPTVLYNDVASPGNYVAGGLRGNYYDTNNPGSNGGFNFTFDEWLLNASAPTDNTPLESLRPSATQFTTVIDFGAGTEFASGDGSVLNRGATSGNPFGGVGVNLGNDQLGGIWEGFLLVPETAQFQFTARSDDNSQIYVDINNDGDFDDPNELVVNRPCCGQTTGPAVSLTAGPHAFKALFGEGGGGAYFQAQWQQNTGSNPFGRQTIPAQFLATTLVGDGRFGYDPNGQFEYLGVGETATDTFQYTVVDTNGAVDTAVASITVTGENDAVMITSTAGNQVAQEGVQLTIADIVQLSDIDINDTHTVTIDWGDGQASTLTVDLDTMGSPPNTPTLKSANAEHTYADQGIYSVSITVSDGTATAMSGLQVDVSNTPPVARDDAYATDENSVLSVSSLLATSATAYLVPGGTAGNQAFGGSLGMDFNVNEPIGISHLGVFDDGSNGLNRTITARVYDRANTAAPLATLVFTPSDPGVLIGGSRFRPLPVPLGLPAGFQGTIVAEGYGAGELNGNSGGGVPVWTTANGGGAISFVGGGRFGAAGSFPASVDGGPANRYAAGTFYFNTGVLANDSDAGGVSDPLLVSELNGNAFVTSATDFTTLGGSVTIRDNGSFTYDPTGSAVLQSLGPGESLVDTFTYAISDGDGGSDMATVSITVSGDNTIEINTNLRFIGPIAPPQPGNDGGAADTIELSLNGGNLEVLVNGGLLRSTPVTTAPVAVIGSDDVDAITVHGLGTGGLSLDGAGGGDVYLIHLGDTPGGAIGSAITIADSGSSGTDTATVIGGAASDAFDVSSSDDTIDQVRRGGTEIIDYDDQLERLSILGGHEAGQPGDTFHVTPDGVTRISVEGDDPTVAPGDQLVFDALGGTVNDTGTSLQAGGRMPVNYTEIERITLNNAHLTVDGTGLDDTLTVSATAASDGSYVLSTNGVDGPTVSFVNLAGLAFNGNAGRDELVIHNPPGGVFAPANPITYDGGADNDALTLLDGTATSEIYTPGPGANEAQMQTDSQALSFTSVEGPFRDTVLVAGLTVNATGGASLIELRDASIAGLARLDFDNLLSLDFANKTNLTVNADGQNDALTVNLVDGATGLQMVTFNGGAGNDTFDVLALPAAPGALSLLELNGDDGEDTFGSAADIRPDRNTPLQIDGGDPAVPVGDTLNLDMSDVTGPVVVDTIGGTAQSASHRDVSFQNIETLHLVDDSGPIDNVDVGDLYVRTTDDRESVTFTLWNDGGVKLRIYNYATGENTFLPQHFGLVGGAQMLQQLLVYAQGGDDYVVVAGHVVDGNGDPIPVEFHGEAGNDYLAGADGDDLLVGGPGRDRVLGGEGHNRLFGDGNLLDASGIPVELPTDGDDQVTGRGGNDILFGGGGDDYLVGAAGDDYLHGGSGDDQLDGGADDDVLIGAAGGDTLSGSDGDDILLGGAGSDRVYGRAGHDVLLGGDGLDQVRGDSGNDLVIGGNASAVGDTTSDAALRAILAAWVSNRPAVPLGLGTLLADSAVDWLLGDLGQDVFHDGDEDRLYDFRASQGDIRLP
ncbi:MAG: hypothetical protein J5I93_04145 [Pirellulaceae bacterium]|nr:hypothetical protein [Pirellulaceae bacterium]